MKNQHLKDTLLGAFWMLVLLSIFGYFSNHVEAIDYSYKANQHIKRNINTTVVNRSCGDYRTRGINSIADVNRCKRDRYRRSKSTRTIKSYILNKNQPKYRGKRNSDYYTIRRNGKLFIYKKR